MTALLQLVEIIRGFKGGGGFINLLLGRPMVAVLAVPFVHAVRPLIEMFGLLICSFRVRAA